MTDHGLWLSKPLVLGREPCRMWSLHLANVARSLPIGS
jgi:hypothetical protein